MVVDFYDVKYSRWETNVGHDTSLADLLGHVHRFTSSGKDIVQARVSELTVLLGLSLSSVRRVTNDHSEALVDYLSQFLGALHVALARRPADTYRLESSDLAIVVARRVIDGHTALGAFETRVGHLWYPLERTVTSSEI